MEKPYLLRGYNRFFGLLLEREDMAKILTIRLPESVYRRVEEAANKRGLLVSEYLRDLVRDAFESKEKSEEPEAESNAE